MVSGFGSYALFDFNSTKCDSHKCFLYFFLSQITHSLSTNETMNVTVVPMKFNLNGAEEQAYLRKDQFVVIVTHRGNAFTKSVSVKCVHWTCIWTVWHCVAHCKTLTGKYLRIIFGISSYGKTKFFFAFDISYICPRSAWSIACLMLVS